MNSRDSGSVTGEYTQNGPADSSATTGPSTLDALVRQSALATVGAATSDQLRECLVEVLRTSGLYTGVLVGDCLGDAGGREVSGPDELVEVLPDIANRVAETPEPGPSEGVAVAPPSAVRGITADVDVDLPALSVARIQLGTEDFSCGTLLVATDRQSPFGPAEREALADVAFLAGSALDAITRRRLLWADCPVELTFERRDAGSPSAPVAIADAADARVTLAQAVPTANGAKLFLTVDGESVSEDDVSAVETVGGVVAHEEPVTLEVEATDPCPVVAFTTTGAAVTDAVADHDRLQMTVRSMEVPAFAAQLRAFRERYPECRCIAKRQVEGAGTSSQTSQQELTRKQLSVLQAANVMGYFERPRDTTGGTIAASLDVSPSTFHQHLRDGLRKLVTRHLDDES